LLTWERDERWVIRVCGKLRALVATNNDMLKPHADFELRVESWSVFYRVQEKTIIVELVGRKKSNVLLIGERSLNYEDRKPSRG
jgi:hypothetical protein